MLPGTRTTRCLPLSRRRAGKNPSIAEYLDVSANMNKRLAGIVFLVFGLPAGAAAIVWARHAHRSALVHQPETIKKTLESIKLPPGFKISLYALVPGARHMAVGPQGKAIFVGTTGTKVYAVSIDTSSGAAGKVSEFAPAIEMNVPN